MAKLLILAPDPCSNKNMEQLCQYFKKLCSPYINVDLQYFGSKKMQKANEAAIRQALNQEGEAIKKKLKGDDKVILMSEWGDKYETSKLATQFESWLNCRGRLVFVFGSAHGFSNDIKEQYKQKLSLSPLTTQHELALVIWMEQLYRIFTIRAGKRYHY
ncbi:MAG: 23S rRNA (pseudouridine(1915)-N(3))-methyltransferase RlmH [Planctomycetes bacterium]|nr:23S rRNA (pseudouridine(1915)-N(3))-methyltransferase RlmH [Planctomycetota bacterium]